MTVINCISNHKYWWCKDKADFKTREGHGGRMCIMADGGVCPYQKPVPLFVVRRRDE